MKSYVLLFLFVISVFVPACSGFEIQECSAEIRQTPHITIATAFSLETEAVIEQMTGNMQSCQYAGLAYTLGEIDEQQVLLFETGVGPEKATKSTRLTLSNFKVEILVFSGIAGGITDYSIGETFAPKEWFDLETGKSISVDEKLFALSGFKPINGATSPKFVEDEQTVEYLRTEFKAVVVDMETYHVAKIAAENYIPFIAFRSVSDHADGEKKEDLYRQAAKASAVQALDFILLYCNTSR